MYRAASSRCSSSGIASSSARSRSIWRWNSSRWLCIEMYSPAAMLNEPAMRPAMPASSTNDAWPEAPATPITIERLDTRPSRDPEDDRAQRPRPRAPVPPLAAGDRGGPRWPPSSIGRMLRGGDGIGGRGPARQAGAPVAVLVEPLPDLRVLALVGDDRLDLRVLALGVVGRLLVALERLHEVRDGARAEDAGGDEDEAHAERAAGPAAGRWPPCSRRRPAQMSACRRSLAAMWRKAAARRGPSRSSRAGRTGRSRPAPA